VADVKEGPDNRECDGMPVIRTVDGSLLIRKYECEISLTKGDVLL
jgi:hypothetical protein